MFRPPDVLEGAYISAVLFATRKLTLLISQTAKRPHLLKVYQRLGSKSARKINLDILPTPPLNFTMGKKVRNLASIFDPVALESP